MSGLLTGRGLQADIRLGQVVARVDWWLIGAALALSVLGLFMIGAATAPTPDQVDVDALRLIKRQGIALVLGLSLGTVLALIDYRTYRAWAPPAFVATLVLLLAVLLAGSTINGAKAWISLGPIQIQPAEFAKITLIAMLASHFHEYREEGLGLQALVEALAIAIIPMLLILAQPDLGTFLVFVAIVAGILLVARVRWQYMGALTAMGVSAIWLVFSLNIIKKYQIARLTAFLDPEHAPADAIYNVKQAQIAVGNGGMFGKTLTHATQTSSGFVPENHTDFIFSVVGEQLGFFGALVMLILYGIVFWRCFTIAANSRDTLGLLLCTGVICVFLFHMLIAVGMTIGVMPVTGLPLLFVSYGGTAMMMAWMLIGIVESVRIHRVV
ncbi:rod shape-determining protein RodA [Stomatohabitans albus]|uniref:rod shape-determining protein RodA n=1 Tax=Stomatohabitans albus TaxID=3110766 RepID=UPI00300CC6A4